MSFIENLERCSESPQFAYENMRAIYTGEQMKLDKYREAAAKAWMEGDGPFLNAVMKATEQVSVVQKAKRDMMEALMAIPANDNASAK